MKKKQQPVDEAAGLQALLAALGGSAGEDEWSKVWDARLKAFKKIFGKPTDSILTSAMPIYLGGNCDVLTFPKFPGGVAHVTAGLTSPSVCQQKNSLGQYELMLCTREESSAAADLISGLANKTLNRKLEIGDVLDFSADASVPFEALLFLEGYPQSRFEFLGKSYGLLLCMGITSDELVLHRAKGWQKLLGNLKKEKKFPFSSFRSPDKIEPKCIAVVPENVAAKDWKGAPAKFIKEINADLVTLKNKLRLLHRECGYGSFARWDCSQEDGQLVFTMKDGSRVIGSAQVIGSFSPSDGSWEWAWNNPHVTDALRRDSVQVKAYGKANGIAHLTRGQIEASVESAWALTAFAAKLTNAAGAYCGDTGGLQIFFTIGTPISRTKPKAKKK